VFYYDDKMLGRITDQTRRCNEFHTCMCGGAEERIQIALPSMDFQKDCRDMNNIAEYVEMLQSVLEMYIITQARAAVLLR
jgi:hypothetical protein